jgi:flagellar protein FlbT
MPLKVSLRAGERIIVNGALMSVDNATELTFHNHVSLMLERQLIRPEEANSPARRIYFAIQNAYVANGGEQPPWIEQAMQYVEDYAGATVSPPVRNKVEQIRAHVQAGEFYAALRLTRELFAHDDQMIPTLHPPGKLGPPRR